MYQYQLLQSVSIYLGLIDYVIVTNLRGFAGSSSDGSSLSLFNTLLMIVLWRAAESVRMDLS